jgi:dihydroorotate dehydrogenase
MYRLLRFFFFLLPAETAHYLAMNLLKFACSLPGLRRYLRTYFSPKESPVKVFGLHFQNRIGLGAGFDKNARYLVELETLGFGFVEIGTVTPKPQSGNEKPRLFRLPKDSALINRMGFNNDGVDAIAKRLKKWREDNSRFTIHDARFLVGGNIGKNKLTPNDEAWKDYEICFNALHPYVDFFVVNVSSPNTPGLRELQEKDALKKILVRLQHINQEKPVRRPILLKIAPDLNDSQLDDVISLAKEISLDGIVATNTTISREQLRTSAEKIQAIGAGGLSGLPVKHRSTEVIRYIRKQLPSIPIIGSGGIFTEQDVEEKIAAGANLVEIWTGFIYVGPSIVKKIA